MSKILAIIAAVFAGWLTLEAAIPQLPGDNWVLLGLSLVFFICSFFIPLP